MYGIGLIVGGCIIIYLLSWLVEWAIVQRVMDSPKAGVLVSVGCATILAIVLAGFGNADGGPFNPGEFAVPYLIAGVAVGAVRFLLWSRKSSEPLE
jgi:hypothetical protein